MTDSQLRTVIERLRKMLMSQVKVRFPPDADLLEAFVRHHDQTAVEMLIWRHGAMVFNLCQRVLHDEHQAEDAFQATFLVFVRKAGSIGKRGSVGSWLYKVAYRLALRMRLRLAKRPERRTELANLDNLSGRDLPDDLLWRDMRSVLDEEIDLLPEKYRSPIVLCYLQGHTTEQAAELLGCPERTIQLHLMRGREQLKSRLTRRGLTLSAGLLASHLSAPASSAAVPAALVEATVQAANQFVAGQSPTGYISASVMALADEGLHSLCLHKLKSSAVVVFAVVALGMGVSLFAHWGLPDSEHNRRAGVACVPDGSLPHPSALRSVGGKIVPSKDVPKNFTNSLGMRFVWIPPGTFVMGSPAEEKQRRADEVQHQVTLTKGFYMGVYTVTQEEWLELMGHNPSAYKGEKNLPVENVSWEECQVFLQKLRDRDKRAYRLPTEAEWEYACRAGTATPFHHGETLPTEQANHLDIVGSGGGAKGIDRRKTVPVGSYSANAWGLHDMHGNVRQWCQDWYDEYPSKDVVVRQAQDVEGIRPPLYVSERTIAPFRIPQGQDAEGTHVARGGWWADTANNGRSACRHREDPARRSEAIGLRVCFSPD